MADIMTPEERHLCMSKIRGKDTKIELLVRKYLFSEGFRYRLNEKRLPGRPDIVLPKYRTVIFVNGCFWHGHKYCKYSQLPKTNTSFWIQKIEKNRERDDASFRQLEALQWNVIVVWECELKNGKRDETYLRLKETILLNGLVWEKQKADRKANRKEYLDRCRAAKEKRLTVKRIALDY